MKFIPANVKEVVTMENKTTISVIIPIHVGDEKSIGLLNGAISSVKNVDEIVIAKPSSVKIPVEETENVRVVSVDTDGTGSQQFCELVNGAVGEVKGDWFSVLEYDDYYLDTWFDHVRTYIEYYPDTFMFMPIVDLYEMQDGAKKFIGYGNESPWASSFSENIGQIDHDCLQYYMDFYPTGSVFNKKEWEDVGQLKPHIKLAYWYEYLLRATSKGKNVLVIPKAGYSHVLNRDGSISLDYNTNMGEDERIFYVTLAKEDYHFNVERDPSKYEFNEKNAEIVSHDEDEDEIEADKAKIMPLGATTKA